MPDTIAAALLSGFVGVLVGGVITYLATSRIEAQKWKQQRKDRLADDTRGALQKAAEWIVPIEFAVARAHAASGLSEEAWLGFVSEVAALQGRPPDVFLVPLDLQNTQSLLMQQMASLQLYAEALAQGRCSRGEILQVLAGIRKLTGEFRRIARDAYNATYESQTGL